QELPAIHTYALECVDPTNGGGGVWRMGLCEYQRRYSEIDRSTNQSRHYQAVYLVSSSMLTFDRMKDKLVVNTITEFERYWSGNSRVTADLLSDLTVAYCCVF